jgi:multidrug efflux pump
VLVGGMAVGTFFTLFVIPSIYMLIARDHKHEAAAEPRAKPLSTPQTPGQSA